MSPNDWQHVYDLCRAFILAGVSIGFVAALLAVGSSN